MIYLIGGAPRVGKSILCQQVAARLRCGWISTDLLVPLLLKHDTSIKQEWDASPEAITAVADWFFPYLDQFVWGVSSMAENYVIEGVGFLPAQIAPLAAKYAVRSVFIGCSTMTFERFDQFPGRSVGYSFLPDATRRQFAADIPRWSAFIQQEAEHYSLPYVDTLDDFSAHLDEAADLLLE